MSRLDRESYQTFSLKSLDPSSPVLQGFYWKITILNLLAVVKVVFQVVIVSSGGGLSNTPESPHPYCFMAHYKAVGRATAAITFYPATNLGKEIKVVNYIHSFGFFLCIC